MVMNRLPQTSFRSETGEVRRRERVNPKRLAREAVREMERRDVCTFAQEALRLELEQRKAARMIVSKAEREAEKVRACRSEGQSETPRQVIRPKQDDRCFACIANNKEHPQRRKFRQLAGVLVCLY